MEQHNKNSIPYLTDHSKVFLRPLSVEDVAGPYLSWMNDCEITQFLETKGKISELQLREYIERCSQDKQCLFLGIFMLPSEKHIGNIKLHHINKETGMAEMGIIIGDKSIWGKGFGFAAASLLIDYVFFTMNLRRITLGALAENTGAIKLYEKLGFVREGVLRQHALLNSVPTDVIRLGLLKDEYLSLKIQQKK